jgi:hypothetical protein
MVVSRTGDIYVVDTTTSSPQTIEKIDTSGNRSTFTTLLSNNPEILVIDNSGNIYSIFQSGSVSKTTPGGVTTSVGNVGTAGSQPFWAICDSNNNIYITYNVGTPDSCVARITSGGTITQAWATLPNGGVYGICSDSSNNIFVSYGSSPSKLAKINSSGVVTLNWATGFGSFTSSIVIDSSNNIYTIGGTTVYKVTPAASVSTFATTSANLNYAVIDQNGIIYAIQTDQITFTKILSDGTVTNPWATLPAGSAILSQGRFGLYIPPTAPSAPTIGTATAASATSAVVSFTPAGDGGSAITGYTVTSSPGGITATGLQTPVLITGLTSGVSYTFTVTATNAIGTSAASSASNSVTPAAGPGDIYVTNTTNDRIAKITPAGVVSANWVSTPSLMYSLASNRVGTIYSVRALGGAVSKVTTSSATIQNGWATVPSNVDNCITDAFGNLYTIKSLVISKVTPAGVVTTNWATPDSGGSLSGNLSADALGNVYWASTNYDLKKTDQYGNTTTISLTTTQGSLRVIAATPDGTRYVARSDGATTYINKIATDGTITYSYAVPPGLSQPRFGGCDSSGVFYYVDGIANVLVKVGLTGTVTQYSLSGPIGYQIAINNTGDVYVPIGTGTVDRLTSAGTFTAGWAAVTAASGICIY